MLLRLVADIGEGFVGVLAWIVTRFLGESMVIPFAQIVGGVDFEGGQLGDDVLSTITRNADEKVGRNSFVQLVPGA